MQVFHRQRQVFGKRPVVIHDAQDGPAFTMHLPSAFAETANWLVAVRRTSNIDFSADPQPPPFLHRFRGDAAHFRNVTNKLMTWCPSKIVIPAKNFNVRVANSGQPNVHQRPAKPQLWQPLFRGFQFSFRNLEAEHGSILPLARIGEHLKQRAAPSLSSARPAPVYS